MRRYLFAAILCAIALSEPADCLAQEDRALFMQGVKASRRGDRDAAFLSFDSLVKGYPQSVYLEPAQFALGEYYFSVSDSNDSADAFRNFISRYRESAGRPFALIYLARILRQQQKREEARALELEVIRFKHGGLIFSDFKEHQYQSASGRKYRALYFVDRIKIYIDNELFYEIPL